MTLISVSVPVILCLFSALYLRAFGGPLGPIPGPLDARFSRLWMIKHSWQGDMHRTMIRLHEKYGSLVRTGPNEVSVTDLSAIKKIYAAGTKFSKSNWYGVWQGHRKFDLFAGLSFAHFHAGFVSRLSYIERDERIHSSQRRLVSPIYSTNALKDLEQYMDNAVAHFCQKMQDRLGQNVDMGLFVQLFAFDVVGEVTFSKRLGFMDAGSDNGFFAQIESMLRSAAWVGQIPTLYWIHDYLSPTIGNYLGVTARHGRLRDFASQEVENRKRAGSDHQDILAKLLEVQKQRPDEMNDTNILSMATTNVAAGSDTTAISIRSVIYHLLKNPECKRRLIEEIDSQMAEVGSPKAVVPLDQTKQMPYLQACLYEGLRLHPAVGMSLPRVTPPGGVWIDRHFIPEGVGFIIYQPGEAPLTMT